MIKTIQANAVYIKSNHGRTRNYIKEMNVTPDGKVSIEFTKNVGEVYPIKDSEIQDAMQLLATPFIQELMENGKTEQEILDWVQENIGSASIDITVSTGEELE